MIEAKIQTSIRQLLKKNPCNVKQHLDFLCMCHDDDLLLAMTTFDMAGYWVKEYQDES